MALTYNEYTGDGSTVLFSFTFPYIEQDDIKVSLDGQPTTEYTLANATTVQMNVAPSSGVTVRIYRQTSGDALQATFYPGSAIRAQDLNDDFEQVLFIAQETKDFAEGTDASSVQAIAQQALDTANQADTTATQAETTANAIAGTANSALTAANNAQTTANSATTTANTALSVANSAVSTSLQKAGGTMTGTIRYTERTIADGVAWDATTGNVWTCAGGTVANPSNQAAGQEGIIRFTGAVTGWGTDFQTNPSVTTVPAIVPYLVEAVGVIRVGQPVGV